MNDWRPIETAPKDGTLIRVGWKEPEDAEIQEWFLMRWAHIQRNPLVGDHCGMWVTPDGGLTWSDVDPAGAPTHWSQQAKPDPLLTQQDATRGTSN